MSDQIQTVRAYALTHPDPRVRKFMQDRIQRELGPPPLPEIEPPKGGDNSYPPPALPCARPQSDPDSQAADDAGERIDLYMPLETDPSVPQDVPVEQPAPQEEIGQPVPSGASQGLFDAGRQPAADDLVGRLKKTSLKLTGAGPTRFDSATDPELRTDGHLSDTGKMVRDAGE